MGLFRKVTSGIGKTVKKAGKQASQNFTAAASMPFEQTAKIAGKVIKAAAPVLKQATSVIQANPMLAGIAGSMMGLPGGLLGGGGATTMAAPAEYAPAPDAGPSVPVWVWIAGGAAALVGLVLILKKKKAAA